MTVSANYAMRHPSCPCGPIPHNHFLASLVPAVRHPAQKTGVDL